MNLELVEDKDEFKLSTLHQIFLVAPAKNKEIISKLIIDNAQ